METSTTLQDQCHIFFYNGDDVQFEDLTDYKRFGLHPVTLGDVLPKPLTCVSDVNKGPRYRIMLKLGHGAFSTVWLARDLVETRYVAVKVGHGSERPLPDREGEVLSQIRETGPGKLGYERVIELLGVFICLVTEVVSPLSDSDTRKHCSYDAVRQIVEGFAFLQREGIVHGDPHIGNLGITLPQLEQFEEDDIIDFFASEELVAVVPRDPKFPMNSLPPYLVAPASIGFFLQRRKAFPAGSLNVKILDFGRAYRMSQAAPNLLGAPPKTIRPPEALLHELFDGRVDSTWSEAADIWAVGCTLLYVKSGGYLISTLGSLKDYLVRQIQFGGPPPPPQKKKKTWPKLWDLQDRKHENCWYLCLSPAFPPPAIHDRVEVWKRYETRAYRNSFRMLDDEGLEFLHLIKRLIITNPDERTPTNVLLNDPFMVKRRKEEESI
ncbi:hypothetical protein E4U52_006848 [Claviceps spartinae]|nr:hypothetical protein E4U52_006848 [Claviceps spartinae]